MKILAIGVLRGPNYWSNFRKNLIVLKIDLLKYEDLPTSKLEDFTEQLKLLLPSLYHHRCSYDADGGFFKRLEEGTWLGHVVEHIALELQWLAGMKCGFGRTRSTSQKGIYQVVFSYEIEQAGILAGKTAVAIAQTLAKKKSYSCLAEDIKALKRIFDQERLGPSTESIIKEAIKRDIPYTRLDDHSLIMLGQGCTQKIICSTLSSETACLGADIAADKENTKIILEAGFIPVPKGIVVNSIRQLNSAVKELGFPIAIKPRNGNHGKGILTNINTKEKAQVAFTGAQKFSKDVLIEKFIKGFDYRFLVINYKLIAVAKRTPASIIGTGNLTIQELIDKINAEPNRGTGHQNFLTKIHLDDITHSILLESGLTLHTVLPQGKIVYLKNAANLSAGGTAIDVTDLVHPQNAFLAERVARLINLDICGIDVITEDISVPLTENNGAVIEVNAAPGFRMHLCPTAGIKRNVAKPVVDMLYPKDSAFRIPLVAVTGTNGKTTIVRLIAHLAKLAGYSVGFTTTEGIYIQNQAIYHGDCSGPSSASAVLRDPIVNFAVLECARGGILRSGLGFDKCSISIVSNVSEDHLGCNEIHTLEELARVKSVVPRSTLKEGYAILNADDDLVYAMKEDLICNIALFSNTNTNPRINKHCNSGGLAAYIDKDSIVIQKGSEKYFIAALTDISLTFHGYAKCMIKNLLPVVLAAFISNFSLKKLAYWLTKLAYNTENFPGRMNLFSFDSFQVLIDYAHNEAAFIELKDFIDGIKCRHKVGIIAATGDRRPCDIRKVGFYAAKIFDEIIIRQDKDSRGRDHQELNKLILEGIKQANGNSNIKVIADEFQAIQYAMDHATPGTFIMYFPDEILKAVDYVKQAEINFKLNNHFIKGQASA